MIHPRYVSYIRLLINKSIRVTKSESSFIVYFSDSPSLHFCSATMRNSSTLSEAYKDHPLDPHHIVPIDFDSVQTVPESYAWNESDHGDFSASNDQDRKLSIPIIDLKDPNAGKLIGHACETWGGFQVINHGIPLTLLASVESEAMRLFSLPSEQKMKALRGPQEATGYGKARMSPFFEKYLWHEGFTIMGSPARHASLLWPHDYAGFCNVMEDYQKKMKTLAEELTRLGIEYLGVSHEEINYWPGESPTTTLQLNSFPLCPEPNRAMGLAPHTDTSILTILYQNASGLQIFKEGIGWFTVQPVDGALVVNVGDLLHIRSNARFPGARHRVVVNQSRSHRLSAAFFYGAPVDSDVSPFAKLLSSGEVARYRPVTVKEYIGIKAKNFKNSLSFIKI